MPLQRLNGPEKLPAHDHVAAAAHQVDLLAASVITKHEIKLPSYFWNAPFVTLPSTWPSQQISKVHLSDDQP
ncbi:MAG: hypothetical protein CL753_06475 [Chloroflexi bacterium]|nr:hypothetical protein [Chloroflexota bacterium]